MSRLPTTAAASHGPDWADIHNFLVALLKTHGVTCAISLSAGPGSYVGAIRVRVVAGAPQLEGPGCVWSMDVSEAFPGHRHKTLEGCLFYLLMKVDARASRELHVQTDFWRDVV